MPIYLVRWPDLTASLVSAEDEEALLYTLDEVANPDDCEWNVYDGPLFIDLRLPVEWSIRSNGGDEDRESAEPLRPEQVVVDDAGPLLEESIPGAMQLSLGESLHGWETGMEVFRRAFPALREALDAAGGGDDPGREAVIRAGLEVELTRWIHASWRRSQLRMRTDPASKLARAMDLPLALARKYTGTPDAGPEVGARRQSLEERPAGNRRLFQVSNHHAGESGLSPEIDGDETAAYYGYFSNENSEQSVYVRDDAGDAFVRMGDGGWSHAYPVRDGRVEGLRITESEAAWIRACWLASRRMR